MPYTFSMLNERQRRLLATTEAIKLGHGGITYVANLRGGHRRTIQRGLKYIQLADSSAPPSRARKRRVDSKSV